MAEESTLLKAQTPELTKDEIEEYVTICGTLEKERSNSRKPYGKLVVESSELARQRIGEFQKEINRLEPIHDKVYNIKADRRMKLDGAQELPEDVDFDSIFGYSAWLSTHAEKHAENIEKLETFAENLAKDTFFSEVGKVVTETGDLYVSGGSIARTLRGQEITNDIDTIVDCNEEDIPQLYSRLVEKFEHVDSVDVSIEEYVDGKLSCVRVIDKNGNTQIDLFSAGYFAKRDDEVRKKIGEEPSGLSRIEKVFVSWTPEPLSQVAIKFDPSFTPTIVNGGKMLTTGNMYSENEICPIGWENARRLEDAGKYNEAVFVMDRGIRTFLARMPKNIDKDIDIPYSVLNIKREKPLIREVGLGYFYDQNDEYKAKIRRQAKDNLSTVIANGKSRAWELSYYGFDGLFSETLLRERGFQFMDSGNKIGDKYVTYPPTGDTESFQKLGLLACLTQESVDLPSLYGKDTQCSSMTEYFALIAGIYNFSKEKTLLIADELSESLGTMKSFDKSQFIRWSTQIGEAVKESNFPISDLVKIKVNERGDVTVDNFETEEKEEKSKKSLEAIVDAIRKTDFWKERTQEER